jgi:cellulose synthase/poly-beta-1,6-N-acetylglucosamine synthase-like glycosyltransferase
LECFSDVPYVASDLYKQQMRWAYGVMTSYKIHIKDIFASRSLALKDKVMSLFPGFGYLLPVLIISMFIFGFLSFVTTAPAPLDLPKFFSEMARNILLTSGLILSSFVALYNEKKLKHGFRMIIASFTVGIVTAYYVNKGIVKSLFKRPMEWYLLNKSKDVA